MDPQLGCLVHFMLILVFSCVCRQLYIQCYKDYLMQTQLPPILPELPPHPRKAWKHRARAQAILTLQKNMHSITRKNHGPLPVL